MKDGFLKVVISLLGLCFIFMIIGLIFKAFKFILAISVLGFKVCLVAFIACIVCKLVMYIYEKLRR